MIQVGKTGSGKSAKGNTIPRHNFSYSFLSASTYTSKCLRQYPVRFGRKIVVVDTPGVFNTKESNDKKPPQKISLNVWASRHQAPISLF